MSLANLRPAVIQARDLLKQGRSQVYHQHRGGTPSIAVSHALADLFDQIVLQLFHQALESEQDATQLALVPHGGYGRRDVAPFSDADLMLLCANPADRRVERQVERLMRDLCDSGLVLGHSLRTPAEACRLAGEDVTIFTSLAEARWLAGNRELYRQFQQSFGRLTRRRSRKLVEAIEAARREERFRYGGTVFLLTPNLKRSYGGLRDIQMVRWVGFARYGKRNWTDLEKLGGLEAEDRKNLELAHQFLLGVRHELHFETGQARDVLERAEQLRLAELYGYPEDQVLLPVEQFMREYFRHTANVRDAASHFLSRCRTQKWWFQAVEMLRRRQVAPGIWMGPRTVGATRDQLTNVGTDPGRVLQLMELTSRFDRRIDPRTWQTIRQSMLRPQEVLLTGEVQRRFLGLLAQPRRLGDSLRRLHELGVLEKIIPAMGHARCLVQFNEYHKYTVDEHCLRAVAAATEFLDQRSPLGEVYRNLANRRTLHLALLLHDLGKGFVEDHSEVGARLASDVGERLSLPSEERETLRFLVQQHLLLSHVAQRRDIHDPAVILEVARQVGSPEGLQMLYVLSCADLAAVGPEVLTPWKQELLTQLYYNTLGALTGDVLVGPGEQGETRRRPLYRQPPSDPSDPWWQRQIAALPPSLLGETRAPRVLEELATLRSLGRQDAMASGRYDPETRTVQYTIGAYEDLTPGIFHRLTGVLTSQRMEILSAEIHTLADGLVLDHFYVHDPDHTGSPPESRFRAVSRQLVDSLKHPSEEPQKFPRLWGRSPRVDVPNPPPKVRFDNNTSERFTILDVFATDRLGLLYAITRLLYAAGMSVHRAKIGTHLDQVVDVFYMTDGAGNKVRDPQCLESLQEELLRCLLPPTESEK